MAGQLRDLLRIPIIQAPLAGGPGSPGLTAAVCRSGGLGFLAAGYKTSTQMSEEIRLLRRVTSNPFGVNVFVPRTEDVSQAALAAYLQELVPEAEHLGVALGSAHWDDDDWAAKIEVLVKAVVPVVSFTFGCPSSDVISALRQAGSLVMVTVTNPVEARQAQDAGADALCLQGVEAGGHQAAWTDRDPNLGHGTLALVRLVRPVTDLPLVAAGGLMRGSDVADALGAGAMAGQLGSAFLLSPEAATSAIHREALTDKRFHRTGLTRSFSGRWARGLLNQFMLDHPEAPAAYPHIVNATKPLRQAATAQGDANRVNLWAGEGYRVAHARPAGEILERLEHERERALGGTSKPL